MLSRRAFFGLAAAAAALKVHPLRAAPAGRLAAIDWAALETVLAMGIEPVAASELRQFRAIAVEPEVPAAVIDLGLRGAPNYELLAMTAPDLVLSSNFYEAQRSVLERVAPVVSLSIHQPGRPPFAPAEDAARTLGERLGRTNAAQALINDVRDGLEACKACLAGLDRHPVFLINLGDSRHFRAFGADSMFGDVLARLGGRNAWTASSRYSAAAPVGIEALAREPEAIVVVIEPIPPEARTLTLGEVWSALPMVRRGRVAVLPPVDHFGGLPSARRFARLFTQAMGQVLHG